MKKLDAVKKNSKGRNEDGRGSQLSIDFMVSDKI